MAVRVLLFLLMVGFSLELENLTVSPRCEEDTSTFLWEIQQETPKDYARLMYDAVGKIHSNVIGGNVDRPGFQHECVSAHGPTFSGQYCQVYLQQGNVEYFADICVPDTCSQEEVQLLLLNDTFQIGQASLIPPIPSILVGQSIQQGIGAQCLPKTTNPDPSDIVCIVVCCIMVALPLLATMCTAVMRCKRNRDRESEEISSENSGELKTYGTLESKSNSNTVKCSPGQCLERFLQNFSLQNTCRGILSTSSVPAGGFSSFSGIRGLSMLWIIAYHVSNAPPVTHNNWSKMMEENFVLNLFMGMQATLAVDSFLLLSGLLSIRTLLNASNRAGGKLSVSLVAKYLFTRIKRIQPLHLFLLCLSAGLYSVVLWGPFRFLPQYYLDCKEYWWTHLLLINNIVVKSPCFAWTWYLAVDFQCYIFSPLLLLIHKWKPWVFAAVSGALLLINVIIVAVITAVKKFSIHGSSLDYALFYYMPPHTRYGPFLIGIVIGVYFLTKKDELKINKWQAALGWVCSLAALAAVIGVGFVLQETPDHPSVPHALYQALHRNVWALALSWIIVACEVGHGGFIKTFLSSGFWTPFSNLSFGAYMVHPIVLSGISGIQQFNVPVTYVVMVYAYIGTALVSLVVSYVLMVLIERPYFFK